MGLKLKYEGVLERAVNGLVTKIVKSKKKIKFYRLKDFLENRTDSFSL